MENRDCGISVPRPVVAGAAVNCDFILLVQNVNAEIRSIITLQTVARVVMLQASFTKDLHRYAVVAVSCEVFSGYAPKSFRNCKLLRGRIRTVPAEYYKSVVFQIGDISLFHEARAVYRIKEVVSDMQPTPVSFIEL